MKAKRNRKRLPVGRLSLPRHCSESEQRAYQVLARTFGGIHHVEGWATREEWGDGVAVTLWVHPLCTFDGNALTALVVYSHEECVRLEIEACAPGTFRLIFHARRRRGPEACEMWAWHPTIEKSLELLGKRPYWEDLNA